MKKMRNQTVRLISMIMAVVLLSAEITVPVLAAAQSGTGLTESVRDTQKKSAVSAGAASNGNENEVSIPEEVTETNAAEGEPGSDSTDAGSAPNAVVTDGVEYRYVDSYTDEATGISINRYQSEDGTESFLVDGDEELIIDENAVPAPEGYEYVGTGAKSGISSYKKTLTYEEIERAREESEEEDAALEIYMNMPLDVEIDYSALISEVDSSAAEIYGAYFETVPLDKTQKEKASSAAETETQPLFPEAETGPETKPEPETETQTEAATEAETKSGVEEEAATEAATEAKTEAELQTDAAREEKQAEEKQTEEKQTEEKQAEEKQAEEKQAEEKQTEELTGAEETSEYELFGYVQLGEPESAESDLITFVEQEQGKLGSAKLTGSGTKSVDIIVVRKNAVYYRVTDESGKGLNGAVISIAKYQEDGSLGKTVTETTRNVNGHDGSAVFDNMAGDNFCFFDITMPGYASQTYLQETVSGGSSLSIVMKKVNPGDLYVRYAAIDRVDIMNGSYSLNLLTKTTNPYTISYMVTMAGVKDTSKMPQVYLMTDPAQTGDSDHKGSKYRYKLFKENKNNDPVAATEGVNKVFQIEAMWDTAYDIADTPSRLPDCGYDDPLGGYGTTRGTRFAPDDKVYLKIINGKDQNYKWKDTGSELFKLNLSCYNEITDLGMWSNFDFNLFGVSGYNTKTGSSIGIHSDLPGLKNGQLNCSLFDFKFTCCFSLSGYGCFGLNTSMKCKEYINSMKESEELANWSNPQVQKRNQKLTDKIEKDRWGFLETYRDAYEKRKITQVSVSMKASLLGIVKYDRQSGFWNADLSMSVTLFGTGEVTGYIFIGPLPVFAGIRGDVAGTVTGDLGLKCRSGGTEMSLSNSSGLGFGIYIALCAYAGIGIHGVLCAEGKGGGYFDISFNGTNDKSKAPVVINGGWNVGYRVTVLWFTWAADIVSKDYQIYPGDSSLTSVLSASDKTEPVLKLYLAKEAEGTAAKTANTGSGKDPSLAGENSAGIPMERFVSSSAEAMAKLPETELVQKLGKDEAAETRMLSTGVAISSNVAFVNAGDSSGSLLRIAYVKESDGKIYPHVIATYIDIDGAHVDRQYVLPATVVTENGEQKKYNYDYGFNAVGKVSVEGIHYIFAVISSGPDDSEVYSGEENASEILKRRAKENRLRVIVFSPDTGNVYSNRLIDKEPADETVKDNYYYVGTPEIIAECRDGKYAYMVTALVSTDTENLSTYGNGIMMSAYNTPKNRHGIELSKTEKYTNIKFADCQYLTEEYTCFNVTSQAYPGQKAETEYFNEATGKWEYLDASGEEAATVCSRIEARAFAWPFDGPMETVTYRTMDMDSEIANLGYANNAAGNELFFTAGGKLYSGQFTRISACEVLYEDGSAYEFTAGDACLNYYIYTDAIKGTRFLDLVSIANEYNGDIAEEGGYIARNTDAKIVITHLKVCGPNQYTVLGTSTSTVPNRAVYMFTGGLMKPDPDVALPGLRIYYLADDGKDETVYQNGSGLKTLGVSDLCNVYVWNWVAQYSATLSDVYVKDSEIQADAEETVTVPVYLNVKNSGPKAIGSSVTVAYTTSEEEIKDISSWKTADIDLNGSTISPGSTGEGLKFDFTVDPEMSGWIRIYCAVIKVDGLDFDEAGFKPVWIDTGDLEGKITAGIRLSNGGKNTDLYLEGVDSVRTENLIIKIFRRVSRKSSLLTEEDLAAVDPAEQTVWEEAPCELIKLDKAGTGGVYNISLDLSNYWLKGFYTGERKHPVSAAGYDDSIVYYDPDEICYELEFMVCGWGDDTWNVEYCSAKVSNPMAVHLTLAEGVSSNSTYGTVKGTGYYYVLTQSDVDAQLATETTKIGFAAKPVYGYRLKTWYLVEDNEEIDLKTADSLNGTSIEYCSIDTDGNLKVTPRKNVKTVRIKGEFEPDPEVVHFSVLSSRTDGENDDASGFIVMFKGNRRDPDIANSDEKIYMINKKPELYLMAAPEYDKSKFDFVGWYECDYSHSFGLETKTVEGVERAFFNAGARKVVYKGKLAGDESRTGTSVYYNEIVPYSTKETIVVENDLQLIAVFKPRGGIIVTLDPGMGKLSGEKYALALNHHLSQEDLDKKAVLSGWVFNGWYTEPEGGDRITTETEITSPRTIYAQYRHRLARTITFAAEDRLSNVMINGKVYGNRVEYRCYPGDTLELGIEENSEYQLDTEKAGFTFYSRNQETGLWSQKTEIEVQDSKFTMGDEDVVIVAGTKDRTDSEYDILSLMTDYELSSSGLKPVSEIKVSSLNTGDIQQLADGMYRVKKNAQVTVTAKEGSCCSFAGWRNFNEKPDGQLVVKSRITGDLSYSFTMTEDKNCYAMYEPKQNGEASILLALDVNGGQIGNSRTTVRVFLPAKGTSAALTTQVIPVKSRARFMGWFTKPADGKKIESTAQLKSGEKLYAQWSSSIGSISAIPEDTAYGNVEISVNGETADKTTVEVFENDKVQLKALERENGYRFIGWYDLTAGEEYIPSEDLEIEEDRNTLTFTVKDLRVIPRSLVACYDTDPACPEETLRYRTLLTGAVRDAYSVLHFDKQLVCGIENEDAGKSNFDSVAHSVMAKNGNTLTAKVKNKLLGSQNAEFTGWYEFKTDLISIYENEEYTLGELVSTDPEYPFRAEGETSLVAVFDVADPHKDDPDEESTAVWTVSATGTGSRDCPTYGTWTLGKDGKWRFGNRSIAQFTSTWGMIVNPYAKNQSADWFYFDENGCMVTGFRTINGKTYYFNETSDGRQGAMLTGWHRIGGKWYYFYETKDGNEGAMAVDTVTPDGYRVGKDGVWIP